MNSHADTEQTRPAAQALDNDIENDFEESEEFLNFVSGDMFEEEGEPENNIVTEAPDVIKELGADKTGVAFTEVTLDTNDDKVEFITGVNVTEDNIEETKEFLDFVTGSDSAAVNVQADRYVVGNNDNAKDATAEQLNYIRENKDKVMEKATVLEKNHFAVVAAEIDADRKAKIMEMSGQNMDKFVSSVENSAKLLPFLNMNRDIHSERLKTLNQKNAALTDKIADNNSKLQKLALKVEKLEAANEMLSSMFGGKAAPIRAIINRNKARIERITNVKLPNLQKRINAQLLKIERNNKKIDREQCKVDKLENLSKAIGSFFNMNADTRREEFSQAMEGLRSASIRSMEIKVGRCNDKIEQMSERYQTASMSDRLSISEKLKKQTEKKAGLTDKINALNARQGVFKSIETQPQSVVDSVIESVRDECAKYTQLLETGSKTPNIDKFSEDLTVSAAEKAEKAVAVENEKTISTKNEPVKSEMKKPKQSEKGNTEKSEKKPRGKRPDIIGSVKYDEIGEKEYFKMSAPEAREKAELLKGSGVKFSGRIYEDGKATLTVERADVPKFREITAQTERKPSVIGEIADIKAKQKSEPKKEAPAKSRQEEL